MIRLSAEVIARLQGKTLATAESCTGGLIGAALTSVPGSSRVYVGGVVSYTNEVKNAVLGVPNTLLEGYGAVSEPVAQAMARGAREKLGSQIAVSVTGLAGPAGDGSEHPVGTVFVGYCDENRLCSREYHFIGDREQIRNAAAKAALELVLAYND